MLAASGPSPAVACIGVVHAASVEQQAAAVASLAALLSTDDEVVLNEVCTLIRSTPGCLEQICALIDGAAGAYASSLQQSALIVLGNFVAEAGTDADRRRIRSAGGFEKSLRLLASNEVELLRCAAGACMNFCRGIEEASRVCELGLVERLMEL